MLFDYFDYFARVEPSCSCINARDPKRKVALKIENKRRFSGHEECFLRCVFLWPTYTWSSAHLLRFTLFMPFQEDEEDAKKEKDAIPLRKYEAVNDCSRIEETMPMELCGGKVVYRNELKFLHTRCMAKVDQRR